MLSAKDISKYLNISLSRCYNLMHQSDFSTTIIGKRLLVSRERFAEYIEKNTRRNEE
ncbi:MAG: helix-turn-helix domain-containing protein [Ruminococcus sp.]|nr:helix-turn-helix domain-containing protein [Ruminococcus sp.]